MSVQEKTISGNGRLIGLTEEQRKSVRERHLVEQEAQLEQAWLTYCAAKAAVEAVRREVEGE